MKEDPIELQAVADEMVIPRAVESSLDDSEVAIGQGLGGGSGVIGRRVGEGW
jgi:hypothetical protein